MQTDDATKLTSLQRWSRALGALAKAMREPDQTDQVLVFSLYANAGSMPSRMDRFFEHPMGRRIFDERRAIDAHTVDLDALAALPEGTLGRAYAQFLRARGLTPDVFEGAPPELPDPRMGYIVQRMRQTHDLWHVVTGFDTDAASEAALQAFTFAQTRAPSSAILAVFGSLRTLRQRPRVPLDAWRAFQLGTRAESLAVFPWEDHWATPLREVRALLGLPTA